MFTLKKKTGISDYILWCSSVCLVLQNRIKAVCIHPRVTLYNVDGASAKCLLYNYFLIPWMLVITNSHSCVLSNASYLNLLKPKIEV